MSEREEGVIKEGSPLVSFQLLAKSVINFIAADASASYLSPEPGKVAALMELFNQTSFLSKEYSC